jgi:hypothetical protein
MKKRYSILIAIFVMFAFISEAQNSPKYFYGMWTLDIEGGSWAG